MTRGSILTFSAVCLVGGVGYQVLAGTDASGAGVIGMLVALLAAAAIVCGMVAWLGGVVLALRAGSMMWVVVAALPLFPINSMVCAMFCPKSPPDARR